MAGPVGGPKFWPAIFSFAWTIAEFWATTPQDPTKNTESDGNSRSWQWPSLREHIKYSILPIYSMYIIICIHICIHIIIMCTYI